MSSSSAMSADTATPPWSHDAPTQCRQCQCTGKLPGPLLPVTWRKAKNCLAAPQDEPASFLDQDLTPARLNGFHRHLWMAGRLLPPRPLHAQLLMSRKIVVTEEVDLHLVWSKGRIFIKPLPRYLFEPDFCAAHVESRPEIAPCAKGLIHTYTSLVASESDHRIACEHGLLPAAMEWSDWHSFAHRFVKKQSGGNIHTKINQRYLYGELRLGRLELIGQVVGRNLLYGYLPETSYSLYSEFFEHHFGKLAAVLAYVVVVLTAMQVGLETDRLRENTAFQRASFGFTVFAVVAPLVLSAFIFAVFVSVFFMHWTNTGRDQVRRCREMRVDPKALV